MVIEIDDATISRTKKVFESLDKICRSFDLGTPIWLNKTVADFRKHSKVRFSQDNFIEHIEFDFLEIEVIEED